MSIVAYPRKGIAYCDELYRAVSELGVEVTQGEWGGRWLLRHLHRGSFVHIHWPSFLYYRAGKPVATFFGLIRFIVLLRLMRIKGARLAWTAHNLYPHDGGRKEWAHRVARRFVTRMCETIFVHGPTAAALIAAEFGVDPEKLEQVPHGHWRYAYAPIPERDDARDRLGLPRDALVYGFVGSCRPYKNLEALVQAFAHMDPGSHLLIAGQFSSPEYLNTVRGAIAPHARDRVHFVERWTCTC
jgi:beta-1,4-mannosyltransferase